MPRLVGDAGDLRFFLGVAEDEAVFPAVLRQPGVGFLSRDVHGQTHLMLTGAGDGYSFQRLFPGFIEVEVKFLHVFLRPLFQNVRLLLHGAVAAVEDVLDPRA